jgi:hypothetical protein
MSIRYTLRLESSGAEVWKRWTGDRDEAQGIALTGLVQVEAAERVAGMFLAALDMEVEGTSFVETTAYSPNLTSALHLRVDVKGSGSDHAVST